MKRFILLICAMALRCAGADDGGPSSEKSSSAAAVIREMNLARQNPAVYADFIADLRANFQGNVLVLPGHTRIRTKEGTRALDEAIQFLRTTQPLAPLANSAGLSHAAADQCVDQASGGFGHGGSDWSNPSARMNRHGMLTGAWAENISYGKATARDVVLALIIDDGLSGRKHRKNIFNPSYVVSGAAFGRHAKFGTMCSVEFASGYMERGQGAGDTLVARNF